MVLITSLRISEHLSTSLNYFVSTSALPHADHPSRTTQHGVGPRAAALVACTAIEVRLTDDWSLHARLVHATAN